MLGNTPKETLILIKMFKQTFLVWTEPGLEENEYCLTSGNRWSWSGGWFNIKMPFYQCSNSHCGDISPIYAYTEFWDLPSSSGGWIWKCEFFIQYMLAEKNSNWRVVHSCLRSEAVLGTKRFCKNKLVKLCNAQLNNISVCRCSDASHHRNTSRRNVHFIAEFCFQLIFQFVMRHFTHWQTGFGLIFFLCLSMIVVNERWR